MSEPNPETPATQADIFDLMVVGAGPTGLACAIEAQKAGLRVVMVEKGCVCNSLFHYPAHMIFFTTPNFWRSATFPFPAPTSSPAATRRCNITVWSQTIINWISASIIA